jgi:deoxyxylulose-5-phosphate synthase
MTRPLWSVTRKVQSGQIWRVVDRVGAVDVLARTDGTTDLGTDGTTDLADRRTDLARTDGTTDHSKVWIVAVGAMAATVALEVGERLGSRGYHVQVASPVWVLPVPAELVDMAGEADLVVTIEDGLADGGVGTMLASRCAASGVTAPLEYSAYQRSSLLTQVETEVFESVPTWTRPQ